MANESIRAAFERLWQHTIVALNETSADIVSSLRPKFTTVTLSADVWTGSAQPYSQVVNINGVTANSKIDLQPTAAQIVEMQNSDISLIAENDDGVVTVYALGDMPEVDYTIQVLITEVSVI